MKGVFILASRAKPTATDRSVAGFAKGSSRLARHSLQALWPGQLSLRPRARPRAWSHLLPDGHGRSGTNRSNLCSQGASEGRRTLDWEFPSGARGAGENLGFEPQVSKARETLRRRVNAVASLGLTAVERKPLAKRMGDSGEEGGVDAQWHELGGLGRFTERGDSGLTLRHDVAIALRLKRE